MRALPTPSANDRPGFHTNMPVSELIEHDTRTIEASVVSSAPLVAKTEDRVTHKTRLTPIRPQGARGLEPPDPRSKGWFKARLMEDPWPPRVEQRARGENTDEPKRPMLVPLRSGQGRLNLLV